MELSGLSQTLSDQVSGPDLNHAQISEPKPEDQKSSDSSEDSSDNSSDASASEPTIDRPRTVIFLLNRNGLDEKGLHVKFSRILQHKYAADDVETLWISIFGKMPEKPHAFITLTDEGVCEELLDDETIKVTDPETDQLYDFEVSRAFGLEAKEEEDPLCLFVTGIPVNRDEETLKGQLKEFFERIAPVDIVIFTKDWKNTKSVIIKFPNADCTAMAARTTRFCYFGHTLLQCRYARKQVPKRNLSKSPNKKMFVKGRESPKKRNNGRNKK